jgi:ABC-2 type transport system permease protein
MIQIRRIWFIALNNLRLFVTDRLAIGMFILFPFLFIVMFNILLGNIGAEDNRLELHLVTLENSGISQQIIQAHETQDESLLKPGEPIIIWDKDYNQDKADVEAKKIGGFLAFPADFTQAVMSGTSTSLEIVASPDATDTRMALNGLAQGIASSIQGQRVAINSLAALLAQQGKSQAEIEQAIAGIVADGNSGSDVQPLITYQSENLGQVEPFNASSYVVPGYLVMFVFFAAAIASVDIIKERRNHTLERLLASSVRKETILGGIYLGGVFRGLIQIAIFWTVGILVFHVDLGLAPWAVIVVSLLMVLMSAAFSVMLATLVKTDRSAGAIAVLVSLVLAPLGGCWWPLFITPQWMQFLSKFTPHGWANSAFNKLMLFGAGPSAVTWEMVALVGFAVAFIVIAIINFRTSADTT